MLAEHIENVRLRAKKLQEESKNILKKAKHKVEQMIIGNSK